MKHQRIEIIDSIRGIALWGILVSIVHGFNYAIPYDNEIYANYSSIDLLWDQFHSLLISKRFIAIFSLLFGIGIAIQKQRNTTNFIAFFFKRMLVLALFGLINTSFFWWGEILLVYSIFGMLTVLISYLPNKIILLLAALVFIFWSPLFDVFFKEKLMQSVQFSPERYSFETFKSINQQGSFTEGFKLRWLEYKMLFCINSFHMAVSFSMMLLGYYFGNKKLHIAFIQNHKKLKTFFMGSFVFTVGFIVFCFSKGYYGFNHYDGYGIYFLYLLFLIASIFSYIYIIVNTNVGSKFIRIFSNIGKLSLTTYMGSALIFSILFHYPGFGLYTKIGGFTQAIIATVVYFFFVWFSVYWTRNFKMGPLEWVYRTLSSGKKTPIK